MKGPSEQARILLEQLRQKPGFLSKLSGRADEQTMLLELAELGEPAVIPGVFGLMVGGPRELSVAAAGVIETLVRDLPPQRLPLLELAIRQRSDFHWATSSEYDLLDPTTVERLAGYGDASTTLLGLASFAANGYARQRAVERLARVESGKELPFLLLRLNDWVAQVRAAALNAVAERLEPGYAGHFVNAIPLVMRLSDCERHDHSGLIQQVRRLLTDERCRDQLVAGLGHPNRVVRRFCVELLFSIDGLDLLDWAGRVAGDPDPLVRFQAVRHLRAKLPARDFRRAFDLFKDDRFTAVRVEIYGGLVDRFGPAASEDELRPALFDRQRSMRWLVRHHLSRIEGSEVDFAQLYRARLRQHGASDPTGTVLGLGETGRASDDELILPFVSHRRVGVRRAAIRALARLCAEKHFELFRKSMLDRSSGVSKESHAALIPLAGRYGAKNLWQDFRDAEDPRVRAQLQGLIDGVGKWDRLSLLLKVADHSAAEEVERALEQISTWLQHSNRSYASPSKDQRAEISGLLSHLEEPLRCRGLLERLRFCLGS